MPRPSRSGPTAASRPRVPTESSKLVFLPVFLKPTKWLSFQESTAIYNSSSSSSSNSKTSKNTSNNGCFKAAWYEQEIPFCRRKSLTIEGNSLL